MQIKDSSYDLFFFRVDETSSIRLKNLTSKDFVSKELIFNTLYLSRYI